MRKTIYSRNALTTQAKQPIRRLPFVLPSPARSKINLHFRHAVALPQTRRKNVVLPAFRGENNEERSPYMAELLNSFCAMRAEVDDLENFN